MKKSIIFLALGALALSSCTQDDQPRVTTGASEGITFRARIPVASRGEDITTANLENFTVYAYDTEGTAYFEDVMFNKDDESGFFNSNDPYFWPTDNSYLSFIAFSPDKRKYNSVPQVTAAGFHVENFTYMEPEYDEATSTVIYGCNIDDTYDFVIARGTGNKLENETNGVNLTFEHAVSKVSIAATTSDKNYTYKVAGVKLASLPNIFIYDYKADNEGNWTHSWEFFALETSPTSYGNYLWNYDAPITLTEEPAEDEDFANSKMLDKSFMIIPYEATSWDRVNDPQNNTFKTGEIHGGYISVLMRITDNRNNKVVWPYNEGVEPITEEIDGEEYAWVAFPMPEMLFEAGYQYIFTIDFTNGAGYIPPFNSQLAGKPVFGEPIKININVTDWYDDFIDQNISGNTNVDTQGTDDPFGIRRR